MSPTQLIPPTSPGQVFAGDGRLRRRFSHTGHGPFRALIVSNLKWGGPCRDHYVLTRETLSGRRPADGADTPGGVFRSGENLPGEGDTADIFRLRPAKTKPQCLLLHPAMPATCLEAYGISAGKSPFITV